MFRLDVAHLISSLQEGSLADTAFEADIVHGSLHCRHQNPVSDAAATHAAADAGAAAAAAGDEVDTVC